MSVPDREIVDVARGSVEYRCSGFAWEHSCERFRPGRRVVSHVEPTAA